MIKVVRVMGENKLVEESLLAERKQDKKIKKRLWNCNLRPWHRK